MSIGKWCDSTATIQHEMMHALGFHHEQVRPDRDNYIVYHPSRVQSGMEHNFGKLRKRGFGGFKDIETPYDPLSVMQYEGSGFMNGNGPTLTYVSEEDGTDTNRMVQAQHIGLSSMDVW